jgi:hypothetical protein
MDEIDMNYINRTGSINIIRTGTQIERYRRCSVRITTSVYPVPAICRFDQLGDWFESLADILHWNMRKSQLNLDTDHLDGQSSGETTDDKKESSPS